MAARFSILGIGLEFTCCDEILFSVPDSISILVQKMYVHWKNDDESDISDYFW